MVKYFKIAFLCSFALLLFEACKTAPPVPTAEISSSVVNNMVTFTLQTTNSTAYKWRFGDGDSLIVYSSAPITHAYPKDATTYSVTVIILGPGGESDASASVTIPVMTKTDMLTGGSSYPNGKSWRISSSFGIDVADPDLSLSVVKSYPAGVLKNVGLSKVYTDEYIFFNDGKYTISPQGGGALAGLTFCKVNTIPNVQPQAADSLGLTYATPYTPSKDLTFALNTGKNLSVSTTADRVSATIVVYNNVNTLSFSPKGFVGLMDFMSECIIQQIDPSHMTLALFLSDTQTQSPLVGKITKVLILTFEVLK